jgi:hypothetical protein
VYLLFLENLLVLDYLVVLAFLENPVYLLCLVVLLDLGFLEVPVRRVLL